MTPTRFLATIRKYDDSGLKPSEAEWKALTAFYWKLTAKAPDLFVPDRQDMIHRVLFSKDLQEITRHSIKSIERAIQIALGNAKPFGPLELGPPGPRLNSKSDGMIAKHFFEKGMELGRTLGALADPVRKQARLHKRIRQQSAEESSSWKRWYPKIETLVARYRAGEIQTQELLRTAIANLDKHRPAPSVSTVSQWVANQKASRPISKSIPRAKSRNSML